MGTQVIMSKEVSKMHRENRLLENYDYSHEFKGSNNSCYHRL
jgi:hypothetical protein